MNQAVSIFAAGCTEAGQICLKNLPQGNAGSPFIQTIITFVVGLTAAISVLFVAIGGVRYVLSQGDPSAVSKAKGTIVYALVGLIVAIVAQFLVLFVVRRTP